MFVAEPHPHPSEAVPIEIVQFCHEHTLRRIQALPEVAGAQARLRKDGAWGVARRCSPRRRHLVDDLSAVRMFGPNQPRLRRWFHNYPLQQQGTSPT